MKLNLAKIKPYLTSATVWLKTVLHAAIGGAAGSLVAIYTDPKSVNFTAAGLKEMWKFALGGAVIALFHLYMDKPTPKGPTSGQ